MDIFVVTDPYNEIFEEEILGVFSSREKAESYAIKLAARYSALCGIKAHINYLPNSDEIECIVFDHVDATICIEQIKLDSGKWYYQ